MSDDRDLRELVKDLESRVAALEHRAVVLPRSVPATQSVDSRFGLAAVNRIGAITLAVGIIFFFKYAVDSEWIGPGARFGIGVVTGFILIAASEWFGRRDQRIFSQGLAGCGLATLYISLYAAFGYYKLIGAGVAFTSLVILCTSVLVLSVRRKNPAVAVLGLFGALLTPQLIELANPQTWIVVEAVYLFAVDLTAVSIALVQASRVLVLLTAAMVALTALLRVNETNHSTFAMLMFGLAILHFATWMRRRYARTDVTYSTYLAGHCFAAFACLRLLTSWASHTALASTLASIFLAVYGIALLSLGLAKGARTDRGLGLAFLGLVVAKLYLYDIWNLAYAARITAFVALGALLLLASFIYGRSKSRA
jgi:uncharacterized membrane protein